MRRRRQALLLRLKPVVPGTARHEHLQELEEVVLCGPEKDDPAVHAGGCLQHPIRREVPIPRGFVSPQGGSPEPEGVDLIGRPSPTSGGPARNEVSGTSMEGPRAGLTRCLAPRWAPRWRAPRERANEVSGTSMGHLEGGAPG